MQYQHDEIIRLKNRIEEFLRNDFQARVFSWYTFDEFGFIIADFTVAVNQNILLSYMDYDLPWERPCTMRLRGVLIRACGNSCIYKLNFVNDTEDDIHFSLKIS